MSFKVKPYGVLCRAALVLAASLPLLGCPPNLTTTFLVSRSVLDFGMTRNQLSLTITKNNSSRPISSIRVLSSQPWILVTQCQDENDPGCVTVGIFDPVQISVGVDRSLTHLGTNVGKLTIMADGASSTEVEVRATTEVIVDFSADSRVVFRGESVSFSDASAVIPGAQRITAWRWDFGDGSPASTAQTPPPHPYMTEGEFTVSLTVTVDDGGATRTVVTEKSDFVIVLQKKAPVVDCTVSSNAVPLGTLVQFTDTTVPGSFQIVAWLWRFGDGGTSTNQNPSHIYNEAGTFDVVLTVTSDDGIGTETTAIKVNFIDVILVPPAAAFTISDSTPLANQVVTFTDVSAAGSGAIVRREWRANGEFITSALNATVVEHAFSFLQTSDTAFDVTLTTIDEFGLADTATRRVVVSTAPPAASFSSSRRRTTTVETIEFRDTSNLGSGIFASREWNFGDGTALASGFSPTHRYGAPGLYTVSMTLTTEHGMDSVTEPNLIRVFVGTELDAYVVAPDPTFRFELQSSIPPSIPGLNVTTHVINLISQTWRASDVRPGEGQWQHWLRIMEPANVVGNTALLFISGGRNTSTPPGADDDSNALALIAQSTNSVVALLEQIPNEALHFVNESNPRFAVKGRTEDEIIAYTFDQFFSSFGTADADTWPLLLPMVKGAVRGMDAVQDFLLTRDITVDSFVVSGASKRGWTTWLTAAADERAVAIAPLVFDVLNMQAQLEHHLNVYGFFSEALLDYVETNVFPRLAVGGTLPPEAQALIRIIDPFEYRERLSMPKLMINSTGDQFFLPDSGRFYLDQLLGDTKVKFVPNTNHGLGDVEAVLSALTAWYNTILHGQPQPQFSWAVEADNRIVVRPVDPPSRVTLWLSSNNARDFRFDEFLNPSPPGWTPFQLSPSFDGTFTGEVTRLVSSWTAFFLEVEFSAGVVFPENNFPYTFSTRVSISPDVTSPEEPVLPIAAFTASTLTPPAGTPVQFTSNSDGVIRPIVLHVWEFGDPASGTANVTDEVNPIHLYNQAGIFTVTLTVSTVHGSTSTTQVITVL